MSEEGTAYGPWYTVHRCKACHEQLTESERMYRHGTCPHCGAMNKSTIVDYYTEAWRVVYAVEYLDFIVFKVPMKRFVRRERKES